jgi:undecaprenyl-diphosphatase
MSALLQIKVLALVQGITEFLPISSSAHLILVPVFTGWHDQGLLIDVAVHIGTLGAVMGYFSRDIAAMFRGLTGEWDTGLLAQPGRYLLALITLGTVPVVIAGAIIVLADVAVLLRNAALIGWTTLIFGILLYVADRWSPRTRRMDGLTFSGALFIGIAQALALIPGTSRSGITMTAARVLGFERTDAAHFSMLLAIPATAAAGTVGVVQIYRFGDLGLGVDALIGAIFAFFSSWLAIAFLMNWLRRSSFTPFVVYRCALGIVLLVYAYTG